MISITFRDASPADTEFARNAHHTAYHDVVAEQFGSWDTPLQDKLFQESWVIPQTKILLCENIPCGYLRTEDTENQLWIHEMVLLPEFQGKGIGTWLLQELTAEAAKLRKPACLRVLHKNRAASLYKAAGFTQIGETGTHYIMQKG
jgi:GNAT superfamily N-acetyltransferase